MRNRSGDRHSIWLSRREFFGLAAGVAAAAALRVQAIEAGSPPQVRRNAKLLSANDRGRLTEAIKATKQIPSRFDPTDNAYDYWVRLHYSAYYDDSMPAHMAPAFGPWHRWFLLLFEQDLQRIDPEITVPYWDWTVDQGRDAYIWDDDFMGGEGDPNDRWIVKTGPFRQGEWQLNVIDPESLDQDGTIYDLQRHFGVYISGGEQQTHMPSTADVANALAIPVYDVEPWDANSDYTQSFRNNLEGFRRTADGGRLPAEVHNRVHNYIGGPMSEGASPNDPLFWLHHSFVDMIYAAWQDRWQSPYLPVSGAREHQNLTDPLWQLPDMTPEGMLDHRALGYVYDRELEQSNGAPWWASLAQATDGGQRLAKIRTAELQAKAGSIKAVFDCPLPAPGY
jgi:tyrosinase